MAKSGFDWLEYYNLALESAKRHEEAHLRTAVSRADYYVYHLALNRAEANEFKPRQGESSHLQLWRLYNESPESQCRRLGQIGMRLKEKRERADYRSVFLRLADEAPHILSEAKTFAEILLAVPTRHPNPKSMRL